MQEFLRKHFHALKTTDNHWLRKSIGVVLVIGGMFGFLPVLGYWMLPLGLALLAIDFPIARRLHRRLIVWWERQRRRWFGGRVAEPARRSPRPPHKPR
jgi:purine-cytosine permease-like protein